MLLCRSHLEYHRLLCAVSSLAAIGSMQTFHAIFVLCKSSASGLRFYCSWSFLYALCPFCNVSCTALEIFPRLHVCFAVLQVLFSLCSALSLISTCGIGLDLVWPQVCPAVFQELRWCGSACDDKVISLQRNAVLPQLPADTKCR